MSPKSQLVLLIIATILKQSLSLVMNCDDATTCAGVSYTCYDEICEINCNDRYACENTFFACDNSHLHGTCQINCAGRDGCEAMEVQSYRDTNILCTAGDSCDKMKINIVGEDPNDKIFANLTSIGGYTDTTHLSCHGDGIGECLLDCRDNGDFYSCIDVKFDCYTPGICRYRCENSDACCGCAPSCGIFCIPTTYVNELNCYYGSTNCIQEDPGGCVGDYGCIAKWTSPTPEPTNAPNAPPTLPPTRIPSLQPTAISLIPTNPPTLVPTPRPTPNPTEHGETAHPSKYPTVSPTPSPTSNPTLLPTVDPTDFPTFIPSNDPSVIPSLSPTSRPSNYPTPDINKADCISITESIENIIGVTTDDFRTDMQLQKYVMNTTKLVLYETIKNSHIYDINALCKHFWRCFYLQLTNIRANIGTIFDIDVCSWSNDVYAAFVHKIVDDAEEMGAYMKQGLEHYLTDGIVYSGYDDVIIDESSRVVFSLLTPSPTGDAQVDAITTAMDPFPAKGVNFANKSSESVVGAVIAVVFICLCILIVGWSCYQKHNRLQRELTETKKRVHALTELTTMEHHISEGGVELDDVAPLNEHGEGVSGTGYTVPMNVAERHSVQSHSYGGMSAAGDGGPGEITEELPDLIDEEDEDDDEDDEDDDEEESSYDEEIDAMYNNAKKSSDDLYGKGSTSGHADETRTGGDKENENENNERISIVQNEENDEQ